MTLSAETIRQAADELHAAQEGRTPIGQLSARFPAMTVADAYGIQQANLARRLAHGARLVGHKIGLTSAPMQTLLRVDEPDFGYLLDDMIIANGATVSRDRFCAPRVEPEVALLLATPLRGPGISAEDVRAATAAVAVALEIVDSRIADWKLTLRDTVADNASSGAIVLGEWVDFTDDIDLPAMEAVLRVNDAQIDSGFGSAVLGDPAAAVAWLANAVAPFGTELLPGQLIMSGSFTTAAFVHAGDTATASITGLGDVTITFS